MAKKMKVKHSLFSRIFSKFLVLIVISLTLLIVLKSNTKLKTYIYENVFQNNLSFAKINSIYKKYFGSSLPILDNTKESQVVSNNTLKYSKIEKYKSGAKLTVEDNYLVTSMDSGIVIFAGEKEGYGKTIVIQRSDDVEVWYANLNNTSLELYDYVKKGENIGEVKNTLYLVYVKDGKKLNYKKYI